MEVNKEQTAVKWLSEQLNKIGITKEIIGHLIIDALEKEKEQITDAYYDGYLCDYGKSNIDGYYDETFEY